MVREEVAQQKNQNTQIAKDIRRSFSFDDVFNDSLFGDRKNLIFSTLVAMAPMVLNSLFKLGPHAGCMRDIFTGKRKVRDNWENFIDYTAESELSGINVWVGAAAFYNDVGRTNPRTGETLYFHYRDSLSFVLGHELLHICGAPDDSVSSDANDYAEMVFGPLLRTREPRS